MLTSPADRGAARTAPARNAFLQTNRLRLEEKAMNEVMLCGAPTVEEIRVRFALPLLTCEVGYWKEFLEGAKTSDLDSNRIGDLKEEIRGKNEAITSLEGRIERIGKILESLRADLDECKRVIGETAHLPAGAP